MKSEAFRPYYSDLLTNLDKISGGGSGYSRRTIRLAGVKDAIIYEEENGAKRYSRLYQVEHFTSMDWFAVFVMHTTEHNFVNPRGAFFGKKNMTPDDMRTRIWQAMLRARLETYRHRSRRK